MYEKKGSFSNRICWIYRKQFIDYLLSKNFHVIGVDNFRTREKIYKRSD